MMNVRDIADELTASLGLETAPIALAQADAAPAGVPTFDGTVPSACTFWRRAETAVFYAPADRHFRCPIGAMVMGFDLPAGVKGELMSLVGVMVKGGYIEEGEAARIPTLARATKGAVYGPLAEFPIQPDFILLWLTPRQAMIMAEASGASHWTATNPPGVLGRPACAAIPMSASRGSPTVSLGCAGMRTYTEIADDRMLAVVPASGVRSLTAAFAVTLTANRAMTAFYEGKKVGSA
jgi:uncharacterized protein (DUF169 family)